MSVQRIKMRHPQLDAQIEVSPEGVAQRALAGWVVDTSEPLPETCPVCGQPTPAEPPPKANHEPSGPADAGAESSQAPKRRRASTSKEDG